MTQDPTSYMSELADLRRAMHSFDEGGPREALQQALDRIDGKPDDLVILDARILPRAKEMHLPVVGLAEAALNSSLTVAIRHLLIVVEVGQLLRRGEVAAVMHCVAARPAQSWCLAALMELPALEDEQEVRQRKILSRMAELVGSESEPATPVLLNQVPSRAEAVCDAFNADLRPWAKGPNGDDELRRADTALLVEWVHRAREKKATALAVVAVQHVPQTDKLVLEQQRTSILATLAESFWEIERDVADVLSRFEPKPMGPVASQASARAATDAALAAAWRRSCHEIGTKVELRLDEWRQNASKSLGAPPLPGVVDTIPPGSPSLHAEAPAWAELPSSMSFSAFSTLQMRLGGAVVGAVTGALLRFTFSGAVAGAAVGAVGTPLLLAARRQGASGKPEDILARAMLDRADYWRQEADVALRRAIGSLHSELASDFERRFDQFSADAQWMQASRGDLFANPI